MSARPMIDLLKGFNNLPFGASKEEAVKVFGEPEEIQNLSDNILNNNSLVYHYWDQGFSLFFSTGTEQLFCAAEIDNRDATLFGLKLFSLKEKEIVELMQKNGFDMSDSEVHNWGEKRISFDEAGLDCYLENNKLVSINFGLLDKDNNFFYFPN